MMNTKLINIAIGMDSQKWHERFASAIDAKIRQGYLLKYQIVNLDNHDWAEVIVPFDLVIWKPAYMGEGSSAHFKEKIYFMEKYLGKLVIPNFSTIWHFESKIAQSYLFNSKAIPAPRTMVSFDYHDAHLQLEKEPMPLVVKKSYGAGSKNVRLFTRYRDIERILQVTFCQQLWDENKVKISGKFQRLAVGIFKPWLWAKIWQKIWQKECFGSVLWQEFIPDNSADLRITVIGDRYAFGFWRNNRPNDFRASGSGQIDFERAVPETLLRYCIGVNRELGFDSMAYDILFTKDKFVITEMSYAYLDSAPYNSRGYYELVDDNLVLRERHTWPQELWVEWALYLGERRLS